MATALAGTDTNRSVDFVFSLVQAGGKDVDPEVDILRRRLIAFRRFVTSSTENKARVEQHMAETIYTQELQND